MGFREHLEGELNKDYELLKKLEDKLRAELDPRLELRWTEDIKKVKQRIRQREEELRSLSASPIQPIFVNPNSSSPATPPSQVPRRVILQWAGLVGVGLVTAVVVGKISNEQPSSLEEQPIAEPKYISPTTEGDLWTVEFETVTVDARGKVVKRDDNKQAKFFKEDLGHGVTLEMVSIPGGKFMMGSPNEEKGRNNDESPQRQVTIQPFFLGKFQITQAQWQAVMNYNPSYFKGDKRPVERVSWNNAVEFCERLSNKTGRKYRLPSEAEWEYACRAKTTTSFHFGETITTDLANYNGNYIYGSGPQGVYREETTSVGSFSPNAFGLYDMHGNVWEWCLDYWHDNYNEAPDDNSAWLTGGDDSDRVVRGGAFNMVPWYCRSADRGWIGLKAQFHTGFRVACSET